MFWIKNVNVGQNKIVTAISAEVLLAVISWYARMPVATAFFSGLLIGTIGVFIYLICIHGVVFRRHRFTVHSTLYEVRDFYHPLKPKENSRMLIDAQKSFIYSRHYLIPRTQWSYYDVYRKPILDHTLSDSDAVLILGGAGCSHAKEIHRRYPKNHIDVVEISPAMISVARQYFLSQEELKYIHLIAMDANKYIQMATKRYAIIMSDIYVGGLFPKNIDAVNYFKRIHRLRQKRSLLLCNIDFAPSKKSDSIIRKLCREIPDLAVYFAKHTFIGISGSVSRIPAPRIY